MTSFGQYQYQYLVNVINLSAKLWKIFDNVFASGGSDHKFWSDEDKRVAGDRGSDAGDNHKNANTLFLKRICDSIVL